MKTVILTNTLLLFWILPLAGWAQVLTISGYVSNSADGKALENVSIFESNSGIGTISNPAGFYRLMLNSRNVDLEISSEGYVASVQHFELTSDTTLIVKLEPEMKSAERAKKDEDIRADASKSKKRKR